ncbi:MAG: hypothetical protein HC896_09885 [Bacteroidales bacterium]|nr:hypothetical protein [Bacteroidales bacterium]
MNPTPWHHPSWTERAVIYEVNTRQFTKSGTFAEFKGHLDRLQDLGVDIIWFMPIYPIGQKQRKGSLGSYYSIKDYKDINPEFGTKEDFKQLVNEIHKRGMYVLIDWVANHTAWDNPLTETNPEFYHQNEKGKIVAPFDWEDVAHLNYANRDLWSYMSGAMEYWVKEFDVDGFRCDVADLVTVEFWNFARNQVEKIKPVFMLAEAENADYNNLAFNMSYASSLHRNFTAIAKGDKGAYEIISFLLTSRAITGQTPL